jgi:hypothetical protein
VFESRSPTPFSIIPSSRPSFKPSPRPSSLNAPATIVGFTSSQQLGGISSDSFDSPAQDAFEASVASTLTDNNYEVASVTILSITDNTNSSDYTTSKARGLRISHSSSISIAFDVVTVLEKSQFTSPAPLVVELQAFLSKSLVTSQFSDRFIQTCVALGSQVINSTALLSFGNVSSSSNFTVTVIDTSSPTLTPALTRHNNSPGGVDFPIWGSILVGMGALALLLVLGFFYFQRQRKLLQQEADLSLEKTSLPSPQSDPQSDKVVALSHDEVQLGYDPELGAISQALEMSAL